MPHDIYVERPAQPRGANAARLALIAVLLGTIFWFGMQGIDAPNLPQAKHVAPGVEDWHGNVRRSDWRNP